MKSRVVFAHDKNDWETPQQLFEALDAEFSFDIDAAASTDNSKCGRWFGPEGLAENALMCLWPPRTVFWLNPPYNLVKQFMQVAANQPTSRVVCLVPARTDTRWWHQHIWDEETHRTRPGVEIRFFRGRLKFEIRGQPIRDANGRPVGAPFPSVLVIFHPQD